MLSEIFLGCIYFILFPRLDRAPYTYTARHWHRSRNPPPSAEVLVPLEAERLRPTPEAGRREDKAGSGHSAQTAGRLHYRQKKSDVTVTQQPSGRRPDTHTDVGNKTRPGSEHSVAETRGSVVSLELTPVPFRKRGPRLGSSPHRSEGFDRTCGRLKRRPSTHSLPHKTDYPATAAAAMGR
jgi:hypothetical protein